MILLACMAGCGDDSKDTGPVLTGTFSLPEGLADSDAPVLVAVANTLDRDILENRPKEAILAYVVADRENNSFTVDLSRQNLSPGDEIFLIAFLDHNYTNDVPFPDPGDFIGVYFEPGKISPAVLLKEGIDDRFHIDITREVFDYTASVSGNILGEETGDVILVAYAGDIASSDFSAVDVNAVIGYQNITKQAASTPYTIDILPYGMNVPVQNVQVFALLDANANQVIDGGDKIGFYSAREGFSSTLLTIKDNTELSAVDISFSFTVSDPSEAAVLLSGNFTLPGSYDDQAPPVYIAVFDAQNPEAVLENPFGSIRYFSRIAKNSTQFSFDLGAAGLSPGDEIMVIGLWDRDFAGGLPNLTPGDMIGIYFEEGRISPAVTLNQGDNSGLTIDITREVFDYTASISGQIYGSGKGDVYVVAYAGEIESSDFTAIDVNDVIGYTALSKTSEPAAYAIDILPYGKDVPIKDVQVIVLLDANKNARIDGGDRIGFYSAGKEFSTLLFIDDGTALTEIDLEPTFTVSDPSDIPLSISGHFTIDGTYAEQKAPVFIAVLDGDDPEAILDNPFNSVRYFSKIPKTTTEFSFDLAALGFVPGDNVMVIGLWDRDFAGGMPNVTVGDFIGIYFQEGRITPAVTLTSGDNSGFVIDVSREVFDYNATISGQIQGEDKGDVYAVAYAGDIESSDFSAIDVNAVIGYTAISKAPGPADYTIDILPYGKDVPIEKVQVIALLDANKNGRVDGGDKIGFYDRGGEFSSLVRIDDGTALTGIDIAFSFTLSEPSDIPLSISGYFTIPGDYAQQQAPVYIAVLDGNDPETILDDPFSAIRYFARIPKTTTGFSFDLAGAGIVPGDQVMVIGLWDRDFAGGLPNLTAGDFIGIYFQEGRITPAVTLTSGDNSGFAIDISRQVYDYQAAISGKIMGQDKGDVYVVAYAGDIESSDFSAIDINAVMGYTAVSKSPGPANYTIDILPYGKDVPLEKVQVIALLDANKNGRADGGDKIGFYDRGGEFSSLVYLDDGTSLTNIDIAFTFTISEPSDIPLSITGHFSIPGDYSQQQAPVYIAVLDGSDPAAVMEDPFSAIRYFAKMPRSTTEFCFDLAAAGIAPGDQVMVIGLWDRDFAGGLPNLTRGDFVGIYFNEGTISPALTLTSGENYGFAIDISREVFDYHASVSGNIRGGEAGDVYVVAYAGEITSSDFSAIDVNSVIGYTSMAKAPGPAPYTIDIIPYGKNVPMDNVQLIALLDANQNGRIDAGDKIGFYDRGGEFSSLVYIDDGTSLTGIDISFTFVIPKPSGYDISIAGTFSMFSEYYSDDYPMYIFVFDSDNPADILEDPYSALKYFYKMPAMDVYFDIDLSNTDLKPGDQVMIAALWDRDSSGGFPVPTRGDKLGLMVNKRTYQFTVELSCGKNIVPPEDYEFKVNKLLYDFDASISYALDLSHTGSFNMERAQLIVLAIHVDGISIGISAAGKIEFNIDMDYILGADILSPTAYDYIGIGEKPCTLCTRKLPILTALYEQIVVYENNRPPQPLIKGVDAGGLLERTAYLVAILDKNGDGQLGSGDEIGYYSKDIIDFPCGDKVIKIPWLGDLLYPDWFCGKIKFPSPIQRITKGVNAPEDGPYWIGNFIELF